MQSRLSSVLALSLMSVLGIGSLTWYYANSMTRQSRARQSAQSASASRAQGDTALPSIGRIDPPPPAAACRHMDVIMPADAVRRSPGIAAARNHAHGDSPGPGARQRRVRRRRRRRPRSSSRRLASCRGRCSRTDRPCPAARAPRAARSPGAPTIANEPPCRRAVRQVPPDRESSAPLLRAPRRGVGSRAAAAGAAAAAARRAHSSTARSKPPSTPRFPA